MKRVTLRVPALLRPSKTPRLPHRRVGSINTESGRELVEAFGNNTQGAKEALSAALMDTLTLTLTRPHVIACGDGTVLVVRAFFEGRCLGYSILGPGRTGPSSATFEAAKGMAEVIQIARDHAHQSYEGILWEGGA